MASALVGADFFCAISIGALLANRTAVFAHVWWLVTSAFVCANCFGAISIGALSANFALAFTAVVTLALICTYTFGARLVGTFSANGAKGGANVGWWRGVTSTFIGANSFGAGGI